MGAILPRLQASLQAQRQTEPRWEGYSLCRVSEESGKVHTTQGAELASSFAVRRRPAKTEVATLSG